MLSFGVKIAWFVLSATGLVACWAVLWAFGRAVNMRWGPILYNIGNTLLQGIFCLGMIYRMDPFQMPRSFCIAQIVVISFGAFLIAGVALAFSIATSLAVLKPKTWGDGERGMRWRNIYAVPIIGFPLFASIAHIVLVFKFNSAQPSDDMHCDSTAPEWIRLVGYAGVPFVMAWPSLYLAIKSIFRISKTNRHLQRARPASNELTPVPRPRRATAGAAVHAMRFVRSSSRRMSMKMDFKFTPPSPTTPVPSPMYSPRREAIQPAIANQALSTRKFHLPFTAPPACATSAPLETYQSRRNSSSLSTAPNGQLNDSANSSRVSVSFPTFVNPDAPPSVVESGHTEGKETTVHEEGNKVGLESRDWEVSSTEGNLKESRDSEQATDMEWMEDKAVRLDDDDDDLDGDVMAKEEYVMSFSGDSTYSPRSPRPASTLYHQKTRRPIPNLAPAVWRIILFQVVFTSVQCLACISTVIDLATKRSPVPLGTQHFALLLAAWGPVIVFGHLPAVRRNLIPWRPLS